MREAGIGRTIFYRHFDDLADLILRAQPGGDPGALPAPSGASAQARADEDPDAVRQRPGGRGRRLPAARPAAARGGRGRGRRRADPRATTTCCASASTTSPSESLREVADLGTHAAGRLRGDRAGAQPHGRELPARRLRARAAHRARDRRSDPDRDLGSGHPPLTKGARPMDVFRTPDERFENLPGYPYEPNYVEVDGLRLHHLDEGSGSTVLCFHGEPSWSYLYRHMLDRLVATGHRVVCPDFAGFGRSDKPTDQGWYTYDRHVDMVSRHLDQLELEDVTVVVQDWGGPIGLRWAVRERGPRGAARDPQHRALHRPREQGLHGMARVRRAHARPADRQDHPGRDDDRPARRGGGGLRGAVSRTPRARRARSASRCWCRSRPRTPAPPRWWPCKDALAGWDKPALVAFSDTDPVFPFPRAGERFTELLPDGRRAGADRGRGPLPPGGSRARDRRRHARGVRARTAA